MSFLDFLSRALAALIVAGAEPFILFGRGHYGEHSCEVILNLDKEERSTKEKVYGRQTDGCMMDEDQSQ